MKKVSSKAKKNAMPSLVMRRLKECGFIAFCALGFFLLIALVTYNASDPSWSKATSHPHSQNAAGLLGAWIADIILIFFGYVAYIFPLLVILFGYLALYAQKQHQKLTWSLHFLGLLFLVVSSCGLVDISFKSFAFHNMPGPSGGILGSLMTYLLVPKLSLSGSLLFFLAMFMIGVTVGTGISWIQLMELVGKSTLRGMFLLGNGVRKLWNNRAFVREIFPAYDEKIHKDENNIERALQLPKTQKTVVPQEKLNIVNMGEQARTLAPKQHVTTKKIISGSDSLPSLDLLESAPPSDPKKHYSTAALETLSREVEEHLLDFGAEVKVVAVCPGPIITRFEMTLAPGLKVSKISGLAKDLARSLSVTSVRVVEVIPGKAVVGLEIPNKYREIVKLRDVLESPQYQDKEDLLSIALGKDIAGIPVVVNLDKMPHLLVAGTTGSGKSVGVNAMLLSLLFKATPEDLRLILIDPKMLELSIYDGIGHLLTPVVTDMNDAANALRWCVAEMERRYQLMSAVGVRNLAGFNAKILQSIKDNKPLVDPLWNPNSGGSAAKLDKLPYVVIIIDEFADMMMVVGKKVEELIARIAQKARAAGIHLILATQRPSVDIITGLIKANIPTRIAFQVSSRIDSRTILDQQGAEQLLGHGDMLYLAPGTGVPTRVHGAFVSDEEVHSVVNALKKNCPPPAYIEDIASSALAVPGIDAATDLGGEQDPLYDEAVAIVLDTRKASISYLQRRLKIGYNRSARLIEAMEAAGLVSTILSNGVREVL